MDITPTTYTTQPSTGWAIASMGVRTVAATEPQRSSVTVLGTPVVLRATPVQFDWSTADGTEVASTSAAHSADSMSPITFDRREHRVRLTLTTTWEGHYSLDGGSTWMPAPGTATTTSTPTSIHVYNPRVQLVDCDTGGDCTRGNGPSTRGPTLTDPDGDGIANHTVSDSEIDAYLDARARGRG